ncbi:MAG TPA: class I SAM-dependent rRNA methyltransferase [Rhizomicrobium sp.]|jgi:23S rRNA (cytosine1962-C5)-methyltransferase
MALHPLLKLRPREGRRLRAGAPWVFSNEIVMDAAAKALAPGSVVNVQGDDGIVFGTGYFNAASLISIRMLDAKADTKIDAGFFATSLKRALLRREALYDAPFYRLVHAEGDGLPGLAIDRFDDVCSIQVTTAGMEKLTPVLLEALEDVIAPKAVVLRNDTPSRALEGLDSYVRAAKGEMPGRISLIENGVRYFADIGAGQKTGWYFDQRDNHAFMAKLAKGRSVLDAYCYAGGFGIVAAKNGAANVTGIDSSQGALDLAGEAASANAVKVRPVKADVFEELERLATTNEKFDVVIADPPPFVKSRKDLEPGAKAYRKLARLAAAVTAPNGFLLLASCSHNIPADRFALECAIGIARANRRGALIHQSGAGADHPVHPMLPETAYLKALVYALD